MAFGVDERILLLYFDLNCIFAKEQLENKQLPSVADSSMFWNQVHRGLEIFPYKNHVKFSGNTEYRRKKAKGERIRKRKGQRNPSCEFQ